MTIRETKEILRNGNIMEMTKDIKKMRRKDLRPHLDEGLGRKGGGLIAIRKNISKAQGKILIGLDQKIENQNSFKSKEKSQLH